MTRDEAIRKNLDLHAEWMKYTFENPDILDKIPKGAALEILPEVVRNCMKKTTRYWKKKKKIKLGQFFWVQLIHFRPPTRGGLNGRRIVIRCFVRLRRPNQRMQPT